MLAFSSGVSDGQVDGVRALRQSAVQPFLISDGVWVQVRDGNPSAMAIFRRHYSYEDHGQKIYQFVGPGEHIVLLTPDARALFVWRKFISDAGELGINCAVFRNEGTNAGRSSDLIRDADRLSWDRWPGERHYTYVDRKKIRSTNPGCCFRKAGWQRCGTTKRGLWIFEILPQRAHAENPLTVSDLPEKRQSKNSTERTT